MNKTYSFSSEYKNINGIKNFNSTEIISDGKRSKIIKNNNGKSETKLFKESIKNLSFPEMIFPNYKDFYYPFNHLNKIEYNLLNHPINIHLKKQNRIKYVDVFVIIIFFSLIFYIVSKLKK